MHEQSSSRKREARQARGARLAGSLAGAMWAAAAWGCGSAETTEAPTGSAPASAPTSEPASAPTPSTPTPSAPVALPVPERCAALIERHWTEASALLAELGATELEPVHERYVSLMSNYRRACEALPVERFACVEQAERSLDALGDCGTNEGLAMGQQLRPVTLTWFVPSLLDGDSSQGREAPPEAEAAELLRTIAGDWSRGDEHLHFGADGAIRIEGRQPATLTGRVVAPHMVRGEGSPSRTFVVFRTGDELFVSPSFQHQPHPVDAEGRAVLYANDALLRVEGLGATPSCAGATSYGRRLADVRCGFEGEGDARRFVVRYRVGEDLDGEDRPAELRASFRHVDAHLVPDGASFWYARG